MDSGEVQDLVRQQARARPASLQQGLPHQQCMPVLADWKCHLQLQDLLRGSAYR